MLLVNGPGRLDTCSSLPSYTVNCVKSYITFKCLPGLYKNN